MGEPKAAGATGLWEAAVRSGSRAEPRGLPLAVGGAISGCAVLRGAVMCLLAFGGGCLAFGILELGTVCSLWSACAVPTGSAVNGDTALLSLIPGLGNGHAAPIHPR